jgi:endonuclease-3
MATASSIKASDKQAICKKLTTALKKRYNGSVPKIELPVMESLVFAACLENESYERAQQYYDRLLEVFHDWNEVRVSSITELEAAFEGMADPDWRALRVRSILQFIFEKKYVFEFEAVRKKTQDLAARQLNKIPHKTPFIVNWVMQNALDSHLVPLDDYMRDTATCLGLLERKENAGAGAESLKAAVRKADAPLFANLLKSLSIEPKIREVVLNELDYTDDEFDPTQAASKLDEIIASAKSGKRKKKKKVPAKKTTKPKAAKKKATKKKAATKSTPKKAAKKPAAKKKPKKTTKKTTKSPTRKK